MIIGITCAYTEKDVLRDVGHRCLGVIFSCPWPKCNGEIYLSEQKPRLEKRREKSRT